MIPRAVLSELEPYVPGKRIPGGIKLSSNENPFGPSPLALLAIQEVTHDLHRYPDGSMHDLKAAIAGRWSVTPESVVVGNGSDEIMVMIAGAFVQEGTNCVTAAHTFSQYTFATQIFGGEMRLAGMADGRFDLAAMAGMVDEDTRIAFLCNPNNPTGTFFGHEELARFLEAIPETVVVVVDEAYAEFAESAEYPDTLGLLRRHRNIIRLRTFSKIYGLAGLRVGYGIGSPELIGWVTRLRQPFNVGSIAQAAAIAALEDDRFVAHTQENNSLQKRELCALLDTLGIRHYPTEANFVCAHIGPRATKVVAALADRRIAVRPLCSFGLPEHVRISFGTPEENRALCSALEEIVTGMSGP